MSIYEPIFFPTADDGYWSATTESDNPDAAWPGGEVGVGKNVARAVRAVRQAW